MAPEFQTADNKEVRGFTWKQLAWLIGAVMTIEATVVGGFMGIRNAISHGDTVNNQQDLELAKMRVDIDLLKIQVAQIGARQDQAQNSHPYYEK